MKHLNLLKFKRSLMATLVLLSVIGLQNVSAQQKNGHINAESVFAVMPEFKTAQVTLEAFSKVKTTDINKMKTELQTKYDQAVTKNKTLSEANKELVMKELQSLNDEMEVLKKRLDDAAQKAQQDVATKESELFAPIQTKFMNAAKLVTKEKGLAYVFDISQQRNSNLMIWDEGIDITDAVKTKLGLSTVVARAPKKQ
jgi:outer membrane protein